MVRILLHVVRVVMLTEYVVEAIIFLAPISAFDQVLAEDPKVNRLVRFWYLVDSWTLFFTSS
jgi:hypothetical protein